MTSNFNDTSVSRNAVREYEKISSLSDFANVLTAWEEYATAQGYTKNEKGAQSYKARIDFWTSTGDKSVAYVNLYHTDRTLFESSVSALENLGSENMEYIVGDPDGVATNDAVLDTWSAKYSCEVVTDDGKDTFTVTFKRDEMLINGFSYDSTLAALEAWADTIVPLGGSLA